MGAECLIRTCLNQQVLTEAGDGGEHTNRNLLKVASDLRRVCQSEKSETEGVAWVPSSVGPRQPPAMPALTLTLAFRAGGEISSAISSGSPTPHWLLGPCLDGVLRHLPRTRAAPDGAGPGVLSPQPVSPKLCLDLPEC